MAEYRITVARSARKEMEALDPPVAQRVLAAVQRLSVDPRPSGSLKLTGSKNDWRILYTIDGRSRTVDVAAVRHRSDAYR